jgi:hypothetical protein
MAELLKIWNEQQLTGDVLPPPFDIPNSPGCSIKINNQSRYWLKIVKRAQGTLIDRLAPFSYLITPNLSDISVEIDADSPASSLNPDHQYVEYSTMQGSVQYATGSTQFNGAQNVTVNGPVTANIENNLLNVAVQGSVNANITNSNINATITNASIPVSGNVNANIMNAALTVSGNVNVTSGTVNANITNATIPVSGNVNATIQNAALNVQGSVNANITNATIPVTGSVNVTNTTFNVQNSPDSPLTVAGAVNIAGTPNVNVTSGTVNIGNTPAVTVTSGTVNVGNTSINVATQPGTQLSVAGTVNIGNTATVTVANTPTVAIAANQTVNIGNTANVAIQGTPTVAISATQNTVNIGNTPSVQISGTPTVNIAQGQSVNIANTPQVTVSGTPNVNVSGGSVSISNTPTVNIAANQSVQISGTPTVNIGNSPSVSISGTPTVNANITGGTVSVNVQNSNVNTTIQNAILPTNEAVVFAQTTFTPASNTNTKAISLNTSLPQPGLFDTFFIVVKDGSTPFAYLGATSISVGFNGDTQPTTFVSGGFGGVVVQIPQPNLVDYLSGTLTATAGQYFLAGHTYTVTVYATRVKEFAIPQPENESGPIFNKTYGTVGTTDTPIVQIPTNTEIRYVMVQNQSASTMWLNFDNPAVANQCIMLPPYATITWESDFVPVGYLHLLGTTSNQPYYVMWS